jgi:predicted DNA-binding protein YlxM (UPF0122 family)
MATISSSMLGSHKGIFPLGIENRCENLLNEGEKCIPLPSTSGNEQILLFGVHSCSSEREEAKQYIHNYYNKNISLTSIADNFQLNQAYLNRLFKKSFQTSIPDYLVKIRMEEAGRFIKEHLFCFN